LKTGLRRPSTRRRGCEGRPRAALGADRASHGGRARSAPDCVSGLRRSSSKDAVDLRCSDGRISSLSPPSGAQIFNNGRQNAPGTSDHIWNAHRCSTGRVRCAQQLPAHPALRSSQHATSRSGPTGLQAECGARDLQRVTGGCERGMSEGSSDRNRCAGEPSVW